MKPSQKRKTVVYSLNAEAQNDMFSKQRSTSAPANSGGPMACRCFVLITFCRFSHWAVLLFCSSSPTRWTDVRNPVKMSPFVMMLLLRTPSSAAFIAKHAQLPLTLENEFCVRWLVPGNLSAFVVGHADIDLPSLASLDYAHYAE